MMSVWFFALPFILAWYVVKIVVDISACALVIPARIIWHFFTISIKIFTGEELSADWEDGEYISAMLYVFFLVK